MPTVRPAVFAARGWYPASANACRASTRELLDEASSILAGRELPEAPVAGLVPHAGWRYSGLTAAAVFRALADRTTPERLVLFSAVHVRGVSRPTLWDGGPWETPIGPLFPFDDGLGELGFDAATDPHQGEHSIEVQLPFVRALWPDVRIAVVMVPPTEEAPGAGRRVAALLDDLGGTSLAIGTTDLTHYGPRYGFAPRGVGREAHRWVVEENDRGVVDLVAALDVEGTAREARARHAACSIGALQAVMAFAAARGATSGSLLHYTTSHDRAPEGEPTDFVGYSGFVF